MIVAVWTIAALAASARSALADDDRATALARGWRSLRIQTACEAMLDDYCVGRHGLTIRSDGSYIIGPSPDGATLDGHIDTRELAQLGRLAAKFDGRGPLHERGTERRPPPGVQERIDIVFVDDEPVRVYEAGGAVTLRHRGAWNDALALRNLVRKLLVRYYPTPFPRDPAPHAN